MNKNEKLFLRTDISIYFSMIFQNTGSLVYELSNNIKGKKKDNSITARSSDTFINFLLTIREIITLSLNICLFAFSRLRI